MKTLCDGCRATTYGSSEYTRNSALIRDAARQAVERGHPVFCVICELRILRGHAISVEHIRSVSHGGTNELGNLGPAHARCNSAVGGRFVDG